MAVMQESVLVLGKYTRFRGDGALYLQLILKQFSKKLIKMAKKKELCSNCGEMSAVGESEMERIWSSSHCTSKFFCWFK